MGKGSWRTVSGVFTAIILAVACLLPALAKGQSGTTSLRGTVLDKTGSVVVGANVALTNAAQGLARQTKTNNSGEYEFLALPPAPTS